MARPLHRSALLALLLAGIPVLAHAQARAPTETVCEAAGAAAELRHGIPAGLLNAIGRIESGRRDPSSGQTAAWPWAINAEGRGKLFDSRDDALAGTRLLQSGGVASIDVGCFQINLVHHRAAFATLEDAFEPAANADYAARFLRSLREKTGSWEQAVANYHSATPERGGPYRDRVLASWQPDAALGTALGMAVGAVPGAALPMAAPPAPRAPGPLVVRVVSWAPATGGMRVWTPSAAGQGAAMIVMPGRSPRG